ncbi:MAG: IPT/TIG domain-containing protein [Myxococcales bacterium]|nr:IPT/TIG domain-containing protein [Myxococcales bacterium]
MSSRGQGRGHRGVRALMLGLALQGCAAEHPLSLSPPRGGQIGGQAVRIEGEGFTSHGPVSVYFGVRAAKAVVIHSPWLITVLTPQTEEPNTVDVRLRFGDGTEQVLEQAFTYDAQPGIVLRPEIGS